MLLTDKVNIFLLFSLNRKTETMQQFQNKQPACIREMTAIPPRRNRMLCPSSDLLRMKGLHQMKTVHSQRFSCTFLYHRPSLLWRPGKLRVRSPVTQKARYTWLLYLHSHFLVLLPGGAVCSAHRKARQASQNNQNM